MKKLKVLLLCLVLVLAAAGICACGNKTEEPAKPAEYTVTFDTAGGGYR